MPIRPPLLSTWWSRTLILLVVGAWLATVSLGMCTLWRYEGTPGPSARPGPLRDAAAVTAVAAAVPGPGRAAVGQETAYRVVMVAHPRCPCTEASLEELRHLAHLAGPRARVVVYFYEPPGADAGWRRAANWRRAAAIPGVSLQADPGGRAARALGARTSGQVLIYDPDGTLRFAGGLTGARGHPGDDNPGFQAAVRLVRTDQPTVLVQAPVFGCPVQEPGEE